MKWIREHIALMPSFGYINPQLDTIETTIETNPDLCVEVCKASIEGICKTILENLHQDTNCDKFQGLVRKTVEAILAEELNQEECAVLMSRMASISQQLGEVRNKSGFASHGQDVEHKHLSHATALLVSRTTDVIGGFILHAYIKYGKQKDKRIHYEDCQAFNEQFDDDNPLELGGVILSASEALYNQDYEAYKETYYAYTNAINEN